MTKLMTLTINGNFENGFNVEVQIGEEGEASTICFVGNLLSKPTIPDDYQCWLNSYHELDRCLRGYCNGANNGNIEQLITQCQNSATTFKKTFTNWLDLSFKPDFMVRLCQNLGDSTTEIRSLIRTEDPLLKKLPWHGWDLFANHYPNAEIAVGAMKFELPIFPGVTNELRILAIFGHDEGINLEQDRETLEYFVEAQQVYIEFLIEPQRKQINDQLWQNNWNILFFAGHSSSKNKTGQIFINRNDSLTIEDLKYGLRQAITHGLQLAIFNSCDGLKLAEDLADLNIPQVIFMREPVIDKVAHAFLKFFLQQFSEGDSLYLAMRHARERLIGDGFDNQFPGSCWLPVIFQNPAVTPPTWAGLQGLSQLPKPPNPYRYLSPFREEDSEYFFGRERVIQDLQTQVEQQNFVIVFGASGSGKSSVVFAGLLPRLRQQKQWLITHFRPQSDPFGQLAQALVPLLYTNKQTQNKELTQLAKALDDEQKNLSQIVQEINRCYPNQRLLLIIDQFEELYTSNPEKVQHCFIKQLLDVIETTKPPTGESLPQFTLLITLRADFLGKVLDYAPFAKQLEESNDIKFGSMVMAELQSALEKPARKQGVKIEDGLTARILEDVGDEPGNLSLLEFALAQLWKNMSKDTITLQNYEAIGGVKQAIAKYANDFYHKLEKPEEQAILRCIMLQLVWPGEEGTYATRQVATRHQIGEDNWDLVIRLADARLVVTSRNKDEQDTVELVHEALIHHWQLLQKWIIENRNILIIKREIEMAAKEWEKQGKSKHYLLQGPKLNLAEEYLKNNSLEQVVGKYPSSNILLKIIQFFSRFK